MTQAVFFQNGTLLLATPNSSLTLINIEMLFDEMKISESFIILDNGFYLEMQVKKIIILYLN